jgi:hypothetical protein
VQLVAEVGPARCFEEGEEVLVAVQLVAQSGDLAGGDLQRGEQGFEGRSALLSSCEWLAVSTGRFVRDGS